MAKLPVSGANSWLVCPLWATMKEKYSLPESETDSNISRLEGLAVHEMIEQHIKHGKVYIEGEAVSYGLTVTEEMLDFMRVFMNFIGSLKYAGTCEESFKVPSVHEAIVGRWDYVSYDPEQNVIHVIDGKFGHTYVEEFNNMQLLLTAEGYVDKYNINTLGLGYELTIIQTRSYDSEPIRTWKTSYEASRALVNKLRESAVEAQSPLPKGIAGENCDRCHGRHACDINRAYVWGNIDNYEMRVPVPLTPKQAAKELVFLEKQKAVLDARVDGLRAQVEFDVRRGEQVDWYRLVKGKPGNLKWEITHEQIKTLAEATNTPLMTEKPITPTQATKFIDKKLIECYAKRSPGKDKLERVTAISSVKQFAKINEDVD